MNKTIESNRREIVCVGWDGQSKPILRYRDELELADHMRSRPENTRSAYFLVKDEIEPSHVL
jgi:hypothetical protein